MGFTRNFKIAGEAWGKMTKDPKVTKVTLTALGRDREMDECEGIDEEILTLLDARAGGITEAQMARELNLPVPSVISAVGRLEKRKYVQIS